MNLYIFPYFIFTEFAIYTCKFFKFLLPTVSFIGQHRSQEHFPVLSLVQCTRVQNLVHLHNSLYLVALNLNIWCTLNWPQLFFVFRYGCYHPHPLTDSVSPGCGIFSVSIWLQQQPIWFENFWNVFSETVFNIRWLLEGLKWEWWRWW